MAASDGEASRERALEEAVNRWALLFYFHRALQAFRAGRSRDFRQLRDVINGGGATGTVQGLSRSPPAGSGAPPLQGPRPRAGSPVLSARGPLHTPRISRAGGVRFLHDGATLQCVPKRLSFRASGRGAHRKGTEEPRNGTF